MVHIARDDLTSATPWQIGTCNVAAHFYEITPAVK
jgi:hypothetical protein